MTQELSVYIFNIVLKCYMLALVCLCMLDTLYIFSTGGAKKGSFRNEILCHKTKNEPRQPRE